MYKIKWLFFFLSRMGVGEGYCFNESPIGYSCSLYIHSTEPLTTELYRTVALKKNQLTCVSVFYFFFSFFFTLIPCAIPLTIHLWSEIFSSKAGKVRSILKEKREKSKSIRLHRRTTDYTASLLVRDFSLVCEPIHQEASVRSATVKLANRGLLLLLFSFICHTAFG